MTCADGQIRELCDEREANAEVASASAILRPKTVAVVGRDGRAKRGS